jgi:serine/threonine-protein kinase
VAEALPRTFGRYLLLKKLGEGGSAAVFFARTIEAPHETLVIKTLHPRLAEDARAQARLLHEATVATAVESPHVVKARDVGFVGRVAFLAMEHVPGSNLRSLLGAFAEEERVLPLAFALGIFRDMLDGLAALHGAIHPATREPLGAVHRDLSPKNLIVTPEGRLVLIDLGLGRSNVQDWRTEPGALLGTPGYWSPEQVAGARIDLRSDLYVAGLIFHELITGRRYVPRGELADVLAFMAAPPVPVPTALRPELPRELDPLVQKLLEVRPEERFASAREAIAELDRLELTEAPRIEAFSEAMRSRFGAAERSLHELVARSLEGEQPPIVEETRILATRVTPVIEKTVTLPTAVDRPPRPPRSRSLLPLVTIALVAAALIVGVVIGIDSAQPKIVPMIEAPPVKSDTPRAQSIAIEEPPPVVEEAPQPVIEKTKRPVPKTSPAKSPIVRADPEPNELFEAVLAAAAELRAKRPERAKELDEIVTEATLWRQSDDRARAAAALRALADRLSRL